MYTKLKYNKFNNSISITPYYVLWQILSTLLLLSLACVSFNSYYEIVLKHITNITMYVYLIYTIIIIMFTILHILIEVNTCVNYYDITLSKNKYNNTFLRKYIKNLYPFMQLMTSILLVLEYKKENSFNN